MIPPRRVLVTGAAGTVGSFIAPALGSDYDLTLLDRRRRPGVRRVDLRRTRRLQAHVEGHDAVVHLAVSATLAAPWDRAVSENLAIDLNVLEAARRAGVDRVVFASSNHVTGLYERDEPYARIVAGDCDGPVPGDLRRIRATDPVRPDSPYGAAKAMTENAGRYYSEMCGLSFLALRIGTVTRDGLPHEARHFATLLTPGDLVRLVRCALEAPPDVRFGRYYGVSANTWRIWDLADAEAEIGYRPEDDVEQFR